MSNELEVLESKPTKIQYKDTIWIPEDVKKKESNSLSSEKIRCWLRFKDIQQFKLDDLRVAFPEWSRYAKSQLTFKINPLVKNKIVQQLNDDKHNPEFKVMK